MVDLVRAVEELWWQGCRRHGCLPHGNQLMDHTSAPPALAQLVVNLPLPGWLPAALLPAALAPGAATAAGSAGLLQLNLKWAVRRAALAIGTAMLLYAFFSQRDYERESYRWARLAAAAGLLAAATAAAAAWRSMGGPLLALPRTNAAPAPWRAAACQAAAPA